MPSPYKLKDGRPRLPGQHMSRRRSRRQSDYVELYLEPFGGYSKAPDFARELAMRAAGIRVEMEDLEARAATSGLSNKNREWMLAAANTIDRLRRRINILALEQRRSNPTSPFQLSSHRFYWPSRS